MPYEPASIRALWNTFKQAVPQAQLGGIGGTDWKPGYHSSANGNRRKWPGNYSIVRPDDKVGDGEAARAIDITLSRPADMKTYTQRLITARQKGDPRMRCVREFFGTVDGTKVTGLDQQGYWVTSDNSHLWHIHLSFYTKWAADHAAMQGVAGVLLGVPAGQQPGGQQPGGQQPGKDQDMTPDETEQMIANALRAYHNGQGNTEGRWTVKKYPGFLRGPNGGVEDRFQAQNERITKLEKKVKP